MDSYLYLVLFVFLICSLSVFKENSIFTLVFVLILSLFAGLRYFSGADYEPYYELFKEIPDLSNFIFSDFYAYPYEPIFLIINSFFKLFISQPYFFLFIISVFSIFSKYIIAHKMTEYSALALLIYYSSFFFNSEFIQIRWALSLSFIYISLYLYLKNRFLYSTLFALIATLTHVTASIVLLVVVILNVFYLFSLEMKVRKLFFMVFISFLLSFTFNLVSFLLAFLEIITSNNYFIVKLFGYLSNAKEEISINVFLMWLLPCISLSFFYYFPQSKKYLIDDSVNKSILNLYCIFISICFICSDFYVFSQRLYLVPLFLYSILITRLIKSCFSNKSVIVINLFLVFIFSSFLLLSFFSSYNSGNIWSYTTWLNYWIYLI